jgi:CheY-like chemotaxis protein
MLQTQFGFSIADAGRRRPRALAVDDDPAAREAYRRQLVRCGFDADVAVNGQDAVHAALDAQALRDPFDVILMDAAMPVVDGWVASSTVRHNGYAGLLVLVSDAADATTLARCVSCGVDHFLLKSADAEIPTSVIDLCSGILKRRHRRFRLRAASAPAASMCPTCALTVATPAGRTHRRGPVLNGV